MIVMGAVLAPGKHTITACLRMTGRADAGNFASYHQLLNRVRWQSAAMTRRMLGLIIDRLVSAGPVVIGVDDTIVRRWGAQDQGARHLSGSGPLQSRPFRQSQWTSLAQFHGADARAVGDVHQSSARADHPRAIRTR